MSKQARSPKKGNSKQSPLGRKATSRPAKTSTKASQKGRKTIALSGRTGVAVIGSSVIVCVLALVALLPLRTGLLAGSADEPTDESSGLIAAPLVEVEVTVPASATPPPTTDEGQEPSEEEPEAGVASLPLQSDIQATPDGAYREGRVPILMYHYISTPPDDADIYRLDLSVTPEHFEEQMAWLDENGYTTITLYQLTDWLANGTELPEKPVILTFDDGYRDNYDNAFPILQKYGQVGTFFILTGTTDEGNPDYMSWDMLREMVAAGKDVEMHAHVHVSVKGTDPVTLQIQVATSAEILEERLGYRPRFFAYPGGEYDDNAIRALKDAGYWLALTTRFGCLHATGGEYELQRIRIRGEYGLGQFSDLVSSAFEDEEFCYGFG